jgi:curved DNA-binding protein CbpA
MEFKTDILKIIEQEDSRLFEMQSAYEVFGLPKNATLDQIKEVYREKALKYHPDKNPGDRLAEELFKLYALAYEVLSESTKRFLYDSLGSNIPVKMLQNPDWVKIPINTNFRSTDKHNAGTRTKEKIRVKSKCDDKGIPYERTQFANWMKSPANYKFFFSFYDQGEYFDRISGQYIYISDPYYFRPLTNDFEPY